MRVAEGVPSLLRERTFRRFWIGQTVSLFGDQVSLLAVPLVAVLVLHAGAADMGYLTAVGIVPSLLFSIYVGVWLDRRGRRRRTMLAADLGRALLLASIPATYAAGALTLGQLYGVAFAVGSLDVLFFVAYSTLFVAITPPGDYLQGNALLNGSRAASQVGGQSLAGLLVAALTAPVAVAADAASFLLSAFFLARISPTEPPTAQPGAGSVGAGVRFIQRSAIVRPALAATATLNYFNFAFSALVILYAVRSLAISPGLLGVLLGAGAVGAVVGSLITAAVSRRIGVGPAFIASCVIFPAPLLLVPAAPGPGWLAEVLVSAAEFGSGLGVMILDITVASMFAAVIPDDLRARVSGAFRMVNYGVRPLGALTGGALGSVVGLRTTLWLAAAGGLTCVGWLIPSSIRLLKQLPLGGIEPPSTG